MTNVTNDDETKPRRPDISPEEEGDCSWKGLENKHEFEEMFNEYIKSLRAKGWNGTKIYEYLFCCQSNVIFNMYYSDLISFDDGIDVIEKGAERSKGMLAKIKANKKSEGKGVD